MERVFKYRSKISPSGGLAAELTAESLRLATPPSSGVRIYRNFWILPHEGIYWTDLAWLCFGAPLSGELISSMHPEGMYIKIRSLTYPIADYRPEVAAVTMDGWLHDECELPDFGVRCNYDPGLSAYHFNWGGREPLSDGD